MTEPMRRSFLCLVAVALSNCAETPPPVNQLNLYVRPWQGRERAETFRLAPPAAGREAELPPQSVQEALLPNGLRVLLVSRQDFPLVQVAWVVRRGAVDAPAGVATMVLQLLAAQNKGWVLQVEPEKLCLFSSVPPGLVPSVFQRGADLLLQPKFSERALTAERARLRTEELTDLPSDPKNLMQVVGRLVYPEGHAYRLPVQGAGVLANSVRLSQLDEFARMHITPDQTAVVAVGDITMSRLQKLTGNAFADWKGKAIERAPPPPSIDHLPTGPAITLVDQPMLTQSQILVAAPGTSILASDFEALEVLNEIVAGAPTTSRVNSVLREELGYTYQAMSSLDARRGPGLFLLIQSVAKESTVESLRTIFSQIERLRSENVPEEELAVSKARLRSSVLLGYDSFQATLQELTTIAAFGLPTDYTAQRLARIRAVTAKQVRAAAEKYLAADRLRTVIVGDVVAIRKPLENAGLGEVQPAIDVRR